MYAELDQLLMIHYLWSTYKLGEIQALFQQTHKDLNTSMNLLHLQDWAGQLYHLQE